MFGKADAKGSPLSGPIAIKDGTIEFRLLLGDADRHSLRIQTGDDSNSFRVVMSRGQVEAAKNPGKGESSDKTVALGRTRVKFDSNQWQTVRLVFRGEEMIVHFAGSETKFKNPVIAERKNQVNFIAFDGIVGIKQAVISGP